MLKWTNTIEWSKSLSPKKGSVIVMKGKVKKSSPRRENGTPSKPSLKTTPAPVAGKPTSLPQNQMLTDPNRNQTPESKAEYTSASNKGQTTNQSNKPQPIQTGLVKDPETGPRGNLNGSSTPLPDNHLYQRSQGSPTNISPQISLPDDVPKNIPQSQSPQPNPDFYNRSPQHMATPSSPPPRPSSPPHSKLVSQTLTRDAYPSPKHQAPSQPYPSSLQTPHSHTNSPSPKHTNLNTTSHQPQYSPHASSVHHGQKPGGSPQQNPVPYQQSDQYYPHETEREPTFQQEQYDHCMYEEEYNQPDNYYNSPQQSHGHRRPSLPTDHTQLHGRQSPHSAQNYGTPGSNQGSGGYPPSANDFYQTENPQRDSDLDNSPYTHQSNRNAAMQHSPGSHRSRSRTRKGSTSPRNVNNEDYMQEHDGYGRDMPPVVDQRYPPEYYDTPMQEQEYPYAYTEDLPMSQPSANVTNSPRVPGTGSPLSQIPSSPGRHMQHSPTSNMPSSTKAQYTANKYHRTPSPHMGTQSIGTGHSPHQQRINSNQNMKGLDQKATNFNAQGYSAYSPTKMEQYSTGDYSSYPMQNGNNQFEGYSPNVPQMGTQHLQGHNNAQPQQGNHMTAYSTEYSNQEQRHNFCRNSYSSSSARAEPQGQYNPENVDNSFQVKTPLKHVDSNTPTKRAPRSPKTPLALPLGVKQPPSPSTVARALKVDMKEKAPTENQQYPPTTQTKSMLPPIPKKEIFVTFPDKQMTKQFVDPNMAMMDLLVQLAASKRLNPSAYVLVAISERDREPIDYKANQPIGLVESHRVKLLPKEQSKTPPYAVGTGNDNKMDKPLPFEDINLPPGKISPDKMTYRLTINLPHAQKVVRRMSANHPLHELHQSVCEEKNLDPNVFVLQRPDKPGSVINLKYTLQELGLQQHELNLVHKASTDHYMSVPDLSATSWIADPTKSNQSQGPSKNYIHMPPPRDSHRKKGFFSFLRKDKKDKSRSLSPTSFSELADTIENWMTSFFSGNSGKQRPSSMFSPVTESLENYMKKPKKSTKSKPAPPPPTSTVPVGVANSVQSYASNTLPRPGSSSSQGETFQNTGHTLGYSNQPAYDSRSSSQSSGRIEPASATGSYITPPSPDAHQFYPSPQSPPNVKQQQPQLHSQPPHLHTQSEINKIGTDSITYMESNNDKHITQRSLNVAEIHEVPQSKRSVQLSKTLSGIHIQKTANDMYASPYKKRKPAPPPPPGGPQVSPSIQNMRRKVFPIPRLDCSLYSALSTSFRSSTSSLDPNFYYESECKTPVIAIKTGSSFKEHTMYSDVLEYNFKNDEKNLEDPDLIADTPAPDACTLVDGTDGMAHPADASTLAATDLSDSLEELTKIQRPCSFVAPPPPLTPPPSEPPSNVPSPITVMEYDKVDKSVGIAEDSLSLAATDVPPPVNGHNRNLSRESTTTTTTTTTTTSSLDPGEDFDTAFEESITSAKVVNTHSEYSKQTPDMNGAVVTEVVAEELQSDMGLFVEYSNNITAEQAKNFRPTTPVHNLGNPDGSQSPRPRLTTGNELTEGTAIYLGKHRNSIASATDDDFSTTDTVTSNISMGETLSPKSFKNGNRRRQSISSEGSFTTVGMSEDYNINGVHDQLPNGDTLSEETRMIPEIVETVETGAPYGMESFVPDMNHVVENEVETHEVNGIEEEIVMSVSHDNASRPVLESSPSLELSRSSSAAELAQYMNSPKEELVLTKEDRKSLDYRGSPMIENQRKQEVKEESKKFSPSTEKRSPKIRLDGYTLSIDSESDTIDSESTQEDSIPLAAQTNLKKQIERWQKQLQEHLNDNSGLYTAQEQEKLREKVDQWNKQLKELNVADSSGFRLLEQKVMKQQIELWQRKLSAKERQSDGAKKYKEQEIEFLKKQVQVWRQKIKVIEKSSSLYTIEEREVLQEQIDLWQSQLDKKGSDTDSSTKEQNLLRHQIEVWKKNLKDKKFAGHSFSAQEQDILRRQLIVWQKQLHWYKDGDPSSQREILKEQVNVWHSQLQDVQSHQDKDSKVEQDILEQQIELWQNKMNEKNSGSEDLVMKQIDIWKKQTRDNQNSDNDFLVIEQKLLQREIQLWNKKLNGIDIESETFLAEEMDVLCDKIDLYQKKLQKSNETNSTVEPIEQDLLKLQVDLWQQKLTAMQERKESLQKYNEEQQNILKFQIELWQDKLAHQNIDTNFRGTELKGSELLAKEIDIWQRWLDVKREKKETRIKFKSLNEELQKDQIRLWQDHLDIIKNNTLGYTEEEREILMQQIELWQRGLVENKDKKIIHLAAEQDILKKYIDLWYTKMKRNSDTSIGEEESEVREQISIWKKQLKLFTVEETPLPHSVQQDILNQQIMVWQKKREKCQTEKDTDELGKIESEILQQQIELWQNDLLDYEKSQNQKENVPQKQIKLLQRKLSKTDKDVNPEITAQENAIVNRQIDLYTKMSSLDEDYNAEYITDEQEILEKQIDLARLKLSQTDGNSYYSETEYDLLQKQVNLWHRQLIAIQHRLNIRKKLAVQEQNLLKEQISLWEAKLKTHLGPSSHTEEQKAMQEQLEIWQQQLEDHKTSILNKGSNVKEDPLADKMAQMLKSQEEIIQSFQEGLKHLPENLKNQVRSSPSSPQTKVRSSKGILPPPPELPQRPVSPKEIKPQIKPITNFPPPPETFSNKSQKQKENSKTKSSNNSVPPVPPKPGTPPPKLPFTVNLKKVGPPKENSPPIKTEVNFFRKQNDTEVSGVVRAVPAMVVLKPPSVAPKPKRKLPEPELTPREQLLMEIKNSSRSNLKGVKLKDTNWSKDSQS
ncbi:uncharacterized protein LOC106877933 isoform X4 [Octopus bimaculoides]|uniref:uncharacterized protein LOC106877933 isoform X4 n=1 Tax=Octopus bimaculoides TaxID=37653 RepID=UPI0022E1661D|nr:uncharacterized protein LOC106877933 isoform X4 [Octopus bimaculoides]